MENLTFTYTCVPGPGTWYYSTVIYLYIYSTHTVDLFSKPFLIVGEVPQVFCVRIYRNLKYYTMRTSRMGTSPIPVKSLSSRHVERSRRSSSLPTSLFPGSSLQPQPAPTVMIHAFVELAFVMMRCLAAGAVEHCDDWLRIHIQECRGVGLSAAPGCTMN